MNYSIQHSSFPQELKLSEVIPVYKKLHPLQRENYRPVSLLPHVSQVFDIIIQKQITNYMTDKLAHSITGFKKSHGTQNSLVVLLEGHLIRENTSQHYSWISQKSLIQ